MARDFNEQYSTLWKEVLRSGEVMMSSTLQEQLTPLLEKVDRILLLLETRPGPAHQRVVGEDNGKEKPSPLSSDDITRHPERFEKLYRTWHAGEGLQVVDELEAMHADELRKFADLRLRRSAELIRKIIQPELDR